VILGGKQSHEDQMHGDGFMDFTFQFIRYESDRMHVACDKLQSLMKWLALSWPTISSTCAIPHRTNPARSTVEATGASDGTLTLQLRNQETVWHSTFHHGKNIAGT
jgi:hypothetical protein